MEDNAQIAALLARMLQLHGYHTRVAPDAPSALHALQAARPQLLTLDLQLSGSCGDTLLRNLRTDPATATLPVVVISANPEQAPEVFTQAQTVLTKPFAMAELIAAVREATAPAVRPAASPAWEGGIHG